MVSYKELIDFVWKYMRSQKWLFVAILLLDCSAWSLDTVAWPYILNHVIEVFLQFESDRVAAWQALKWPIVTGISLIIYIETAFRTMGFLMARTLPKLQADIRMAMFDHVQRHSPRYFNDRFAGGLANKITDMTTQLEIMIQQIFWPILPAISSSILGTLFLSFISPIFGMLLLVWIAIHLTICVKFTRSCERYEHQHAVARSTLLGRIVDSFTNNFAVNLFFRFDREKRGVGIFQQEEERSNRFSRQYVEKMRSYLAVLYFFMVIVGINGTLIYMWIRGQVSTGQVVQVFNTILSLAMIFWNVGSKLPTLFQAVGGIRQAYQLMLDPQDIRDVPLAKPLKVKEGKIVFSDVTFAYGGKKLFKNKHVTIQAGEKVGLVGFSGAGKSTFINLILRFFPIDGGKILIDDQDIAGVTLESLRSQIALIPQDPLLFHRSLRENIAYGANKPTQDQIIQAAKLAHCTEFIENLPQKYETKVGERGTKLSGGEKQRIAIARAILADAPILILDEATSALDSVTERYIQDSLEKLMENRTSLVIAHRLSTLVHMDRILVFDKGKIVEEGSHDFLINNRKGLYAKMWKMQVDGFIPDRFDN